MLSMSIPKKLRLSLLAVVLLLSGVIVFLLAGLNRANRNQEELVNGPYQQEMAVSQSRLEVLQFARDIRDFYIQTGAPERAGNQETQQKFETKMSQNRAHLDQALEHLREVAPDVAGMEEYYRAVDEWLSVGDEIISAVSGGDRLQAAELILNDCPRALDRLTAVAEELGAAMMEDVSGAIRQSDSGMTITLAAAVAAFLVAVVLAVILSIGLQRSILPPLKEIQTFAEALEQGNLKAPIVHRSKDEFGKLADSMRASQRILASYITDISTAMHALSDGNFNITFTQDFVGDFAEIEHSVNRFIHIMSEFLKQVGTFAEQVQAGTEQVAAGALSLAEGTTEQAGSIEEIAANIGGTSEMVTDNAGKAEQASAAAASAGQQVTVCGEKMDAMTGAMGDIEDAVNQIRQIMSTIEEIALQTNLLALNAAVEAAHAGAAGKGFAVVADEVRSLAAKSTEASKRTAELIEHTIDSVKHGSIIAADTSKTLFDTMAEVRKTAEMLSGISAASREQANLLSQVNIGIEQISAVVQNNSATAQQSAAASRELAELTQSMEELVSGFEPRSGS